MNVLARFISYISARLRAFLSSADDPRKAFNYTYQRQSELLVKVRQALDDIIVTRQKLEAKVIDMSSKLPKLQNQARDALIGGKEDTARFILLQHHITTSEIQIVNGQIREIQQEEHRLALVEQRLVAQIETFITRQQLIAARYSSTEAQERISETLSNVSQELADLGIALQEAEEKAKRMQAQVSAFDRLVEAKIFNASSINTSDIVGQNLIESDVLHNIEGQLATLKHEINQSNMPPDRSDQ